MNTRKSRLAPLNLSLTVLYRPQDTRCLHRDKPHTRAFESCFPLFPDLRLCRVGHRPLASRAPRSRWCSLVGQHASGGSAGDLRRRSSKPPGSLCHHPSPGAARTRLGTAYLSRPHCDRPTTTTTMEALTSIAHDAAISPRPDSAAVVPGLAHTARAHPATISEFARPSNLHVSRRRTATTDARCSEPSRCRSPYYHHNYHRDQRCAPRLPGIQHLRLQQHQLRAASSILPKQCFDGVGCRDRVDIARDFECFEPVPAIQPVRRRARQSGG